MKIGLLFLSLVVALSSCVTRKNVVYFTDIPAEDATVRLPDYQEPTVQADDILHVTIQTIDGGLAMAANPLPIGAGDAGTNAAPATGAAPTGYLVTSDGHITMPMLGTFKVAGLTTSAVRDQITQVASRYFKDPTVQVRFANFRITVIGEVARPATYTVSGEKVTLLEALGMAGDLTIYGKRENVLLIRDHDGKKEFVRLNLTEYDTFRSPYFYLRQNDIIYVEPGSGRLASLNSNTRQAVTLTLSVISLVTVLVFRFL